MKIHQKKLLTNVGYMNSYQALSGARNLPNSVQRKFLESKDLKNKQRFQVRKLLKEDIEVGRNERMKELQNNKETIKSIRREKRNIIQM